MARLYVVNTTGQNRVLNYRTEFSVDDHGRRTTERNQPYKSITIPARTQVPLGGDMHINNIKTIIGQIERTCGAVPASDIVKAKAKGVVRMVYSIDAPVPTAVLKDVVHHNLGLLTEQGADRRERLAMGANLQLGQIADTLNDNNPNVEVEFQSVDSTEDKDLSSPSLEEGFKVAAKSGSGARRRRGRG